MSTCQFCGRKLTDTPCCDEPELYEAHEALAKSEAENARLRDAVVNAYALLTTVRRNWSKVDITDDLVVEAHRTLEAVLQRDKEGA